MQKHRIICSSLLIILSTLSCGKSESDEPAEQGFQMTAEPVFESPYNLAGDPSLLKDGNRLLMYYTAEQVSDDKRIFGVVVSEDNGQTWNAPDGDNTRDYPVLYSQPNGWDNTLETVEVIRVGSEYWMYYSGYREGEADNAHVENYEIGLAISTNGVDFVRHPSSISQPIIQRNLSDENTLDRHAMTSPGVVVDNHRFYMIYAGWNVAEDWTGPNAGIRIMSATSEDGIVWTKSPDPLIEPAEVTYSPDINEATLLKSPDGFWYVPFSTDNDIGIARSASFEGTYEIYSGPIANADQLSWATEVTAPDGFIEDGKMRLWYHGVSEPAFWPWVIGYVEGTYPIDWK